MTIYLNIKVLNKHTTMNPIGLLTEIFDKRILNKYLNLLPNTNIFYYIKFKPNSCSFLFYIAKEIQDLTKNKLDTSKIIGYITGNIDISIVDIEKEDIDNNVTKLLDKNPKYKSKIIGVISGNKKKFRL